MSKIPSLNAQGNISRNNNPGGNISTLSPNSGVTMGQWPAHDASAAAGAASGTPQNEVHAPENVMPGVPLNFPAKSAPATLEVAGRAGAPDREDGRG